MAATRKLQGEIDRCLKKVTEGVETFEDIWQKVHNATNSNQKEKYEADLKKEIKKLQRLRDQIKSWIASGEIKDKSTLLEYRKLIETQMERFKVVERETKTKAYSKEGLGAAQKLDPAQKEREEMSSWLVSSIDALNLQVDQFESEVESLLVGKKKRLDKEKQDRMEELKIKLEKHRFHIKKLETLLRMLDNMSVEVEQIKRIKEDVEYYIDSSLEPGFEENDYIYDDITGLDEIELSGVGLPSSATTDSNNSNDSAGSPASVLSGTSPITSPALEVHNHSTDSIDVDKKKKDEVIAKPVKPMAVRAVNASAVSNNSSNVSSLLNNSAVSTNSINNSGVSGTSTPSKAGAPSPPHHTVHTHVPHPTHVTHATHTTHAPHPHTPHHHTAHKTTNNTAIVENGPVVAHAHPAPHLPPQPQPPHQPASKNPVGSVATVTSNAAVCAEAPSPLTVNGPSQPQAHHTPQHTVNNGRVSEASSTPSLVPALSAGSSVAGSGAPTPAPLAAPQPAPAAASLKAMAQEAVQRAGLDAAQPQVPVAPTPTSVCRDIALPLQSARRLGVGVGSAGVAVAQAHIPPLLGVAPLGPLPLSSEHQLQFQMMEAAFYHMPHPSDSERTRFYLPRNICQTPLYYNQVLLPHSDSVEFFQRLSTETLFFVFYYMEGTKAQYLAAKALKKQSWRFHTKYMMWFQRHEEPKVINEEYEQGTYIYFDYEKWGQRKKEGFTFEYKYLEDRDLN
ncbi:CCR4-NOT transcription complex subunit 3 isoform X2 [Hyposmocoma kahamanoa]|uniref:CCR4-NOT transcription complex subunit 3 isoform X2 n=1 Tax=Hyposmocoma kahamanoa TaxID=1477025 RepID=UPI000E6D6670|nr:CCR4-NOT transcription complex subunit 3 isoform X2 [Hyposmocoma kahamanoa]